MNHSLNIRTATLNDLPQIASICLKTGANGKDATPLLSRETLVSQLYAEPYLRYDLTTCFVLTVNNLVLGYVIGALDTSEFNQWMNSTWLPSIRPDYSDVSPKSELEASFLDRLALEFETPDIAGQYPSHLHVDILSEGQGLGAGRLLLNRLFDELTVQGSTGVHLGVGLKNKSAISFYRHLGFETLSQDSYALILGMKLPRT